ncbi:unnamed protein product [Gadus morhua 'NCC']
MVFVFWAAPGRPLSLGLELSRYHRTECLQPLLLSSSPPLLLPSLPELLKVFREEGQPGIREGEEWSSEGEDGLSQVEPWITSPFGFLAGRVGSDWRFGVFSGWFDQRFLVNDAVRPRLPEVLKKSSCLLPQASWEALVGVATEL